MRPDNTRAYYVHTYIRRPHVASAKFPPNERLSNVMCPHIARANILRSDVTWADISQPNIKLANHVRAYFCDTYE
jgi:hypothetical protein